MLIPLFVALGWFFCYLAGVLSIASPRRHAIL
jgi:hypothetical protein